MSKFGFGKAAKGLNDQTKMAAILMMRASKKYFGEAFDKEELESEKWKEVARRTPGTPFYKDRIVTGRNKATGALFTRDQGPDWQTRKILAGETGRLKYKTIRADSSITNMGAVSVMTNPVPYARYINDGTPYMPARPFMKHTDELTVIHLDILKTQTGKIWMQHP
jgi:phage gpG-like protein